MLPATLLEPIIVYKSNHKKIRLGRDNDGGYIICEGLEYDCFLSGGVSDDCSLEEDFLKLYPHLTCFAFDGTIQKNPETKFNIQFINKNIGDNTNNTTNFSEYFEKYNDIFIKMDIEGHEFPWLNSLNLKQMRKIKQLVIEFHYPYSTTGNLSVLDKLTKTHWLVHLHPHNGCGIHHLKYIDDNGLEKPISIPNLIECTYIRKDFLPFSTDTIPHPLDQVTSVGLDEMALSGYPYNAL